jgi:hypothetical protein
MATKAFDITFDHQGVNKRVATSVAVHTTQSSCDVLDVRGIRYMQVKPPAGVTSLTFYGSETETGTFVLIDSLGTNGVVTTTASVWNLIDHTKLAAHSWIQMKSAGATGNAAVVGST